LSAPSPRACDGRRVPTPHRTHVNNLSFDQFNPLARKPSKLCHLMVFVACPQMDMGCHTGTHRGLLHNRYGPYPSCLPKNSVPDDYDLVSLAVAAARKSCL